MRLATDVVPVPLVALRARLAGLGLRVADVVVVEADLRTVLALAFELVFVLVLALAFVTGLADFEVLALALVAGLAVLATLATALAAVAVEAFVFAAAFVRLRGADLDAEPSLAERCRWFRTIAHSASLKDDGLLPWALASFAAFSMSLIRLVQDVAKRLSDWERAPLSTRVSTTPAAVTFLRRRLKISF